MASPDIRTAEALSTMQKPILAEKTDYKKSDKDRFWEKVMKTDSCWEWTGSKAHKTDETKDYGFFYCSGRHHKAHRFSWEIHNKKKIPNGMLVCHKCDNPSCVNPNHLFLGTYKDNLEDCRSKGRVSYPKRQVCKRGHPFVGENVYVNPTNGFRKCKACNLYKRRLRKALARSGVTEGA